MVRMGFPSTNFYLSQAQDRLHRAQTRSIHRLAPELSMAVSFVSDKNDRHAGRAPIKIK